MRFKKNKKVVVIILLLSLFCPLTTNVAEAAEFRLGLELTSVDAFKLVNTVLPTARGSVRVGDFGAGAGFGYMDTSLDIEAIESEADIQRYYGNIRYYILEKRAGEILSPFVGGRVAVLRGDIEGDNENTEIKGDINGTAFGPEAGVEIKPDKNLPIYASAQMGYEYASNEVEEKIDYKNQPTKTEDREETVHSLYITGSVGLSF